MPNGLIWFLQLEGPRAYMQRFEDGGIVKSQVLKILLFFCGQGAHSPLFVTHICVTTNLKFKCVMKVH